MVAGRMRSDSASGFLIGKQEDGVSRPTRLECADFLEVLALEEKSRARLRVKRCARQHGGALDLVLDARVGFADERQGQAHVTAVCVAILV